MDKAWNSELPKHMSSRQNPLDSDPYCDRIQGFCKCGVYHYDQEFRKAPMFNITINKKWSPPRESTVIETPPPELINELEKKMNKYTVDPSTAFTYNSLNNTYERFMADYWIDNAVWSVDTGRSAYNSTAARLFNSFSNFPRTSQSESSHEE